MVTAPWILRRRILLWFVIRLTKKGLYHITQTDPSFMQLHPFAKLLYILMNETCSQNLIAKCLYKMFKIRSSVLYHS